MNAKGVEALVQASNTKIKIMSATLATVEVTATAARENTKVNKKYSSDKDCGVDATSSGKPLASPSSTTLITFNKISNVNVFNHRLLISVRLHHKMVCNLNLLHN
jgi:hypothetical protein